MSRRAAGSEGNPLSAVLSTLPQTAGFPPFLGIGGGLRTWPRIYPSSATAARSSRRVGSINEARFSRCGWGSSPFL